MKSYRPKKISARKGTGKGKGGGRLWEYLEALPGLAPYVAFMVPMCEYTGLSRSLIFSFVCVCVRKRKGIVSVSVSMRVCVFVYMRVPFTYRQPVVHFGMK